MFFITVIDARLVGTSITTSVGPACRAPPIYIKLFCRVRESPLSYVNNVLGKMG